MPPVVAAAAIAAGATTTGAVLSSKSSKRASNVQSQSDQASLEEARARDAEAKRQFDIQQQFETEKWKASEEQRLHDRALADALEARRAPYRAASQAALGRLADMLGLQFDRSVPATAASPSGAPPFSMPPPINHPMMTAPPSAAFAPPGAYDATRPGYQPVNPMMNTGQLLNLRGSY